MFFDPDRDVLYFGPRDGFMASEAQLRTVLTLCDPEELLAVRRVAVNDALFWVYGGAGGIGGGRGGGGGLGSAGEGGPIAVTHTTIASSLLVDVLQLARARLPGLRELVFVPRDENPVYSGDCYLVEPAIVQSRLARQVREAMGIAFDGTSSSPAGRRGEHGGGGGMPWTWRVMTLSADPHPPVYRRAVLGWEEEPGDFRIGAGVGMHGDGHGRRWTGAGAGASVVGDGDTRARKRRAGREATRLGALQESVRRRFMQMEMGVCR